MAAVTYYPRSEQYPTIVQAIVENILLYLCYNIYPLEAVENIANTIRDRTFLANISDEDETLTQSARNADIFGKTNLKFPFTAYSLGNRDLLVEQSNLFAAGGYIFNEGLGYGHAIPCKLTLPLITFFNRAEDFNIAFTSFLNDNASLTRIKVPVLVNGLNVTFTVDVQYTTLEQGTYASSFTTWLKNNNIWDIVHTAEVKYYEYMWTGSGAGIDDSFTGKQIFGGITQNDFALVDPGQLYLNLIHQDDDRQTDFQQSQAMPDVPAVVSVVPANNATAVAATAPITIVFSNPMNEQVTRNAVDIVPYVPFDSVWSQDSKTLTLTPRINYVSATNYTLTINRLAEDYVKSNLESDYISKFTTA
jgi:hypothetical protein